MSILDSYTGYQNELLTRAEQAGILLPAQRAVKEVEKFIEIPVLEQEIELVMDYDSLDQLTNLIMQKFQDGHNSFVITRNDLLNMHISMDTSHLYIESVCQTLASDLSKNIRFERLGQAFQFFIS